MATAMNGSADYNSTEEQALVPVTNPESCMSSECKNTESPLTELNAHTLLTILACELRPEDLSSLESTCKVFRRPAGLFPDYSLSITEVAAWYMCQQRTMFKLIKSEERDVFKQKCGGSWKLVLGFLMAGEACTRRGKFHAIAGTAHSIVVTDSGDAYTFGDNSYGQLGHETRQSELKPRLIGSLQGIRIIDAAAGWGRTILVSDVGRVFVCGTDAFAEGKYVDCINTPQTVESLESIFIVQATIGYYFTAVLSREGRVYTFCWGGDAKLGACSDVNDRTPRLLNGALENIPVVQIAAGDSFLLALAWQPSGMSVYWVGHGFKSDEQYPRLIEEFQTLRLHPISLAAGDKHAAVVGKDGRVCTWGLGTFNCLGHGSEDDEKAPKVIAALEGIKVVHIAAGFSSTFAMTDNGDVFYFGRMGCELTFSQLVVSLQAMKEQVVYVSSTKWGIHTLVLTKFGNLYMYELTDIGVGEWVVLKLSAAKSSVSNLSNLIY